MHHEDLPTEFDIIVLGTGLTETIVAAAFSRIGLKVLHLDRNGYYGGSYANFSLHGIEEWEKDMQDSQESSKTSEEEISKLLNDDEILIGLPTTKTQAHNIKRQFHVRHRTAEEVEAAKAVKDGKNVNFNALLDTQSPKKIESKEEEVNRPEGESTEEDVSMQNKDVPCNDSQEIDESFKSSSDIKPQSEDTETLKEHGISQDAQSDHADPSTLTGDSESAESGKRGETKEGSSEVVKGDVRDDCSEQSDKSRPTVSNVDKPEWTVEGIEDDGKKFCFDLSPRVLYCSGELVELLIRSDVARYCEFRTVSRNLTFLKGSLQQVPCSRADVFSSKSVSLVEKRLMMKFLQFASNFESCPEEYKDYIDKPFLEFLSSKKLSANVKHYIQNAIAMVPETATTSEGLKKTQTFLRSLGRYGNTAFLFPLYGSGELPQAFSRLSAVFGGIYCLMLSATHIVADKENKCCGIITSSGQRISCRYLVGEVSYLPSSFIQIEQNRKTSRAILITDKSIYPSEEAELSLLNFISEDDKQRPVTVLELPYSASVCPKGVFTVHLTRDSKSEDDVELDFVQVKDKLFGDGSDETKPKILWTMHFSQSNMSTVSLSEHTTENVLVTSAGGDNTIDSERIVEEAKQIFHKVCPEEEFLAKPPNPDDIILVDDVETNVSGATAEDETEGEKEEEDKSSYEVSPSEKSNCEDTSKEEQEE